LSVAKSQKLPSRPTNVYVADVTTTLPLSPKTVETYRARMMEKLDIHDFATLVKFAIQHGITSLE
jgi:DNA-binding NarL/FixJ family response regulator